MTMSQIAEESASCESVPMTVSCEHSDRETLFPARDYLSGDPFSIVRCKHCGLAMTDPAPSAEHIGDYYPQEYYGTSRRFVGVVDGLLDRINARKARSIARAFGGAPGRILEVGCGHGLVLEQFKRLGWETTGTEMSAGSSLYAREALGLDVKIGDLLQLGLPEASYDLILIWHVLEHLPDPEAHLREVGRLLRPGGLAVIGVPNFGSVEARWARDRWFHLDVPRHLTQFTPETLKAQLQEAGLDTTRVGFFSPEHDYFSFTQTALNMLGLRFNLLYDLLRRRGAKVPSKTGGAQALSTVGTVLLTPVFAAVSLLLVPLAAITRRGSAMVAYARKPV